MSSGYSKILKSIGRDLPSFFCSLDSLHEHVSNFFPGMRPPSFGVSECGRAGSMVLRYCSERSGLEFLVIGAAKAAARALFGLDIDMRLQQFGSDVDHVEFSITHPVSINSPACLIEEPAYFFANDPNTELEAVLDPVTFCNAFPFHVIFDREMIICQAGVSLVRVIPDLFPGSTKFPEAFSVIRPHISLTFQNILRREHSVFVVKTREGWMKRPSLQEDSALGSDLDDEEIEEINELPDEMFGEDKSLRLKGQMVYLPETDTIMFLCSPRILSLDSLDEKGNFIFSIGF